MTNSLRAPAPLRHRWPTLLGLVVAAVALLVGADRDTVAMTATAAAACYLAAAAFSLPWMAWAWIPIASVLALGGVLLGFSPVATTAAVALVLVAIGLLRGAARPTLTRETAGFVGFAAFAVASLALSPRLGLVVAAVTLIGHGAWDLWHLRAHRRGHPAVVSPSLAECCVALDVPLGLGVLVLAVV